MSSSKTSLQIFVIGGRIGESVVIRTPGGHFGVIDSYSSDPDDPDTNPTITRLRHLGARRLRFVALTHPHMDHFRGLASVFRQFPLAIEQFWRPPFGQANWSALFASYLEEYKLERTITGRERIAERTKRFRELLELAQGEKMQGTMRAFVTQDIRPMLVENEHNFSITCLGPSTETVDEYQRLLARNVISKGSNVANAPHNAVSSVLAVRYGKWLGLLGGDTERKSWEDILDRYEPEWISPARFVKVSHHGSATGSYDRLWESIRSDDCNAVVTCFESQGLPTHEGIRPIRDSGHALHSTSKNLALRLSESREPGPRTANPIILLPGLKKGIEWGEVGITVDPVGRYDITYYGAAGGMFPSAQI